MATECFDKPCNLYPLHVPATARNQSAVWFHCTGCPALPLNSCREINTGVAAPAGSTPIRVTGMKWIWTVSYLHLLYVVVKVTARPTEQSADYQTHPHQDLFFNKHQAKVGQIIYQLVLHSTWKYFWRGWRINQRRMSNSSLTWTIKANENYQMKSNRVLLNRIVNQIHKADSLKIWKRLGFDAWIDVITHAILKM